MRPTPPPHRHTERERETGRQVDWSLSPCLSLSVSVSLSLAAGVGGSLRVRRQRARRGRDGRTFTSSGSCSFSLPGSSLVRALMHKSWSLAHSLSFSPLLPLNSLRPSVCVSLPLRTETDRRRGASDDWQTDRNHCPPLASLDLFLFSTQFQLNLKYVFCMIVYNHKTMAQKYNLQLYIIYLYIIQ